MVHHTVTKKVDVGVFVRFRAYASSITIHQSIVTTEKAKSLLGYKVE
jgi:hypothetical protein